MSLSGCSPLTLPFYGCSAAADLAPVEIERICCGYGGGRHLQVPAEPSLNGNGGPEVTESLIAAPSDRQPPFRLEHPTRRTQCAYASRGRRRARVAADHDPHVARPITARLRWWAASGTGRVGTFVAKKQFG